MLNPFATPHDSQVHTDFKWTLYPYSTGYNSKDEFQKIPNEIIFFIREEIDEDLEDKLLDINRTKNF